MMTEVPVYLFVGFMDSGKTSLILETLYLNHFADDVAKFLIISLEDGEEEYDEEKLAKMGGSVVHIDNKEDFNTDKLLDLDEEYEPEAVFIEYNGTWDTDEFFDMEGPENWTIVQTLATVDSTTFEMYMLNMRQLMVDQLKRAEAIIFNRCSEDTPKGKFRANIKAINRPAQIIYEREDGSIDDTPEELPFDIDADEIEITDMDYALWFMDCMDHPDKYNGKSVTFLGLVYNPPSGDGKLAPKTIVPGRFAMTCCVEDIQFLGMKCVCDKASSIEHKSWIKITAKVKKEYVKEYKSDGPVLYSTHIEPAKEPEDSLVYFN